MKQIIKFSNPVLVKVEENYPLGGSKRGRCVWSFEFTAKRGYRCARQTTGKAKYTTYGGKGAIVDGEDGRTYILQRTPYGFDTIHRWDFMSAERSGCFESDPDFAELNAMIDQANQEVA